MPSQSCSFSLSVSSHFLSLSLSCFFSAPRTATQQWDGPPSCKDNNCHLSPPNNNNHQDPNWQQAMTTTTTTIQRQQLTMMTHKQQQAPMTTTMQQWQRAQMTAHCFNNNQQPHPHHPQITMATPNDDKGPCPHHKLHMVTRAHTCTSIFKWRQARMLPPPPSTGDKSHTCTSTFK